MRSSVEVNNFLQSTDSRFELVALSGSVKDSEQMSELLGLDLSSIVKILVFIADGSPIKVIVPADRRADILKIKSSSGAELVYFAPEKDVADITDFIARSTPPVAWKTAVKTFIDSSLTKAGVVYSAGGQQNVVLKIRAADLIKVTGAIVADIT